MEGQELDPKLEAARKDALTQYRETSRTFSIEGGLRSSGTKNFMERAVENCRSLGISDEELTRIYNEIDEELHGKWRENREVNTK